MTDTDGKSYALLEYVIAEGDTHRFVVSRDLTVGELLEHVDGIADGFSCYSVGNLNEDEVEP